MTWSFQENKNPCKEGFLPMSVGNGLPGGRGMHAAPICKVNPPVGQTFHFLPSHASRSDLGDRTNPADGHSGKASGPSPSTQWLSAPSMLFAHFGFARESNRSGSRQYERRRVN